ncbi:MAG: alpha/beta fold hydrolase [Alsobacter sp.]
MDQAEAGFRSHYVTAADGLRLHTRDYGAETGHGLPVVCLAGLTRNSVDFHDLALALATCASRPRRVLALDYRGRGLSDRDPDWTHYDARIEVGDVLAVLAALGVAEAVFVGTSRGGLVTMGLSGVRPALIRGAVLNDIGPVIEPAGLLRIRSYVGKLPEPRDMDDAVALMRHISGAQFPGLSDADWLAMAQGTFVERDGRLVSSYDPALMKPLATIDIEGALPTQWPLFAGLCGVPVLVIRGENSDLLSPETLLAMSEAHRGLLVHIVPGQGHAPLLRDSPTIERIISFVGQVEDGRVPAAD